ncbi:indolepyruvate ferredoxin oxidoreductase family protein [Denitratisoma oestradiolicum]|uniref:Indolepyruvate ferredoxin oxidoreductase n=1 Tax=Denitratisoma oestradiolicum TaxID=311182 RepID=A0A6S6XTL4_9PROT|nr:indolepyruvate ferredoxin oxidoreductase family protein [Denitratisoma oestradiolicum]TWO79404.1 indolepyruvate ferredoxin oxidoreductase [Denitratisoma oestradiolicum]CAB1368110.1 Indolepyruvate ferredoxin oxidoreductase [Denitratisoma oestradiolicum]
MNAPLGSISLDDKYTCESGRVFLTGTQALARLAMLQRQRDSAAGLNTAGYISGYRGSPLGGLDLTLWKAREHLERHHILFRPGINEDLAATALWGSQQLDIFPGSRYDGVFGLWYGKGPGVDRCGDVFKHANSAGTARHGGVIAVAGDDHAARSSTLAHQSEHMFKAAMMPVLAPSGVQDYLDLGLHGWAMSRYSGCWVGFKAVADTIESSASVEVDPARVRILLPTDFELPPGGLNIRWPDERLVQEERLINHKLYAALAYCRANGLNRVVIDSPHPRLGIIACGKSYLDVRQAFDDLGLDEELAARIGIRLYKVGMVWPLEADGVRRFAQGLEEILVVEEKRQFIEYQLKEELYNWREDVRPRVIGKFDEKGEWALPHGDWQLPATGELTPAMIARVIANRIDRFFTSPRIRERLAVIEARERAAATPLIPVARIPHFCPGCPHNTSTRLPEGSRAVAGIGCHYMVTWMERNTATVSHMGGEGVAWLGQAPFTEERHVFANLGDGTYFHSGVLAIRAAVAAGANITYKLLYNDAVAMTGGQPLDGPMSIPIMARQLQAEGVGKMVVVNDGTPRGYSAADLPPDVAIRHRDELDAIQREMRQQPGVTAILYDQTCAAEKRRRRRRGKLEDPARHVFINTLVCEGCGDCGRASNCLAIVPVDTEFGRKRAIDQSSCNKDYSCLNGFCPSFVTIEGGRPRRGLAVDFDDSGFALPPLPTLAATAQPYSILVTGVGGTGVITLGALIGMAAHIDGKGVSVLDMTGMAQKGGAVFSHVRICDDSAALHAVRIATGEADAVIGGDIIVTASNEALVKMQPGRTRVAVNCAQTPTAEFTRNPDWQFPLARMQQVIGDAVGTTALFALDATRLITRLMGDEIYSNLFLLGYAWQRGLVPVSLEAIQTTIGLNGTAVETNRRAFLWGRRAAHDQAAVERFALPTDTLPPADLDSIVARRVEFLTTYQDAAYGARYRDLVERVRAAEQATQGSHILAEAVAHNYFKLLAVKDEYEVARLYAEGDFLDQVRENFEGDYRIHFHLAPPLLARPDPVTGRIRKREFGPWMLTLMRFLAPLRRLRGTPWDIFGRSPERRLERQLIADYEADIDLILTQLSVADQDDALALARLPEAIRGYGPVKQKNVESAHRQRAALRTALANRVNPQT